MRLKTTGGLAILIAVQSGECIAQYREGPPVTAPVSRAPTAKPQDIAPLFAQTYRQSGSPRMMLLWNRELSDQSESVVVEKQTTRETGSFSSNSLNKTTQGPTGSATLSDAGSSYDRSRTVSATRAPEADAALRANRLTERNGAMLRRVFVDEMNRGGVQFVDRALAIRLTAASAHRGGGDPKLIETDALVAHADLLMEVVMIEDGDAPCGYGFDVRAKDLKRGVEIASVYSRAIPPPAAVRLGHWVAGANDYVFSAPPPSEPPNAGQVGSALARDVMFTLGSRLEADNKLTSHGRPR